MIHGRHGHDPHPLTRGLRCNRYSCKISPRIAGHEYGHNFGLNHARANNYEYGSIIDVMGLGDFEGSAYTSPTLLVSLAPPPHTL